MSSEKIEVLNYFRSNIFEAYAHYNAWKVIFGSKSKGIVSEELANKYLEIQKYHNGFFILAEKAFLISFTLLSLHSFDDQQDSLSLYKLDRNKTLDFLKNNKATVTKLRILRNKLFAHKDVFLANGEIPSINDLDTFFKNLILLYNEFTKDIEGSKTDFGRAEEIKNDTEALFMNLYRGENVKRKEIEIEWDWNQNNKKISDIL